MRIYVYFGAVNYIFYMTTASLAVINKCPSLKSKEVTKFIGALYWQLCREFARAWKIEGIPWYCQKENELRADDWRLYLWPTAQSASDAGMLGYHSTAGEDYTPVGHVFVDTVRAAGEPWTAIASHEALELVADPWVNLDVARRKNGTVELWPREICDAVQGLYYTASDVELSNFVLPEYFIEKSDGPFDHLGKLTKPFEIHESGYSAVMTVKNGRATRRDIYGAVYPSWRKEERPHSRKSARFLSELPCGDPDVVDGDL